MSLLTFAVPFPGLQRAWPHQPEHVHGVEPRFQRTLVELKSLAEAFGGELDDVGPIVPFQPRAVTIRVPDSSDDEALTERVEAYLAETYVVLRECLMKADDALEGFSDALLVIAKFLRPIPVVGDAFAVAHGLSEVIDDFPDLGLAALDGQPEELRDVAVGIVSGFEDLVVEREVAAPAPATAAVPAGLSSRLRACIAPG